MNRLLLTGAAGGIGRVLRERLAGTVPVLRVSDRAELGPARAGEEVVQCDISEGPAVADLCRDVDAIIHLGAVPNEQPWPDLLSANIEGAINLWEGARLAGVQRVIFASSNHAIGFYERTQRIDDKVPPKPDSRYGVTKVFGEAMAHLYAMKFGIRGFCLRIGTFGTEPQNARMLSTWISHGDMERLVRVGLEADYRFEIVYGMSRNTRAWWDNSAAYRLGYDPQDDAEAYADKVGHIVTDDAVAERYQGGSFVSAELRS